MSALRLRAVLDLSRGEVDLAIGRMERLARDRPDDVRAQTGAALIAYLARDFDRAVAGAGESLRLAPENTLGTWHRTEVLLGLSLLGAGERERGRDVVWKAIQDYETLIENAEEDYADYVRPWDLATAYAA